MDSLLALCAALAASLPLDARSVTQRSDGATTATVTARIVSQSARIGRDLGPPERGMIARPTAIAGADGQPVAALVYDFQ